MQISQFFLNGDMKGAIAYMRNHEEFKDILPRMSRFLKIANTARMKYRTGSTISCVCIRSISATLFIAACRRRKPQKNCWRN